MENDIWAMLNESEQALMREIEPRRLRKLDEDELIAVHKRVRRARNKYAKNYRRGAAAQVAEDGGRGKVSAKFSKTARKAEAFEEALATVSTRLAKVARQRSDELKAERLAAAGRHKKAPKKRSSRPTSTSSAASEKRKRRTPARKRASAQSRAATRRHQAKRAGRA